MKFGNHHDALYTMYPAFSRLVEAFFFMAKNEGPLLAKECLNVPDGSSVYGYLRSGEIGFDFASVKEGAVFAVPADDWNRAEVSKSAVIWTVVRYGYHVPFTITVPEHKGRLSYIDGCTDSMLVYPARKGDGSLSLLQFPRNINQSWHTHPSIRLGYVLSGEGMACYHKDDGEETQCQLKAGTSFMLPEHGRHRFQTFDNEMRIIAYHPDGDWGPTDENHPMLNRTYLSDK